MEKLERTPLLTKDGKNGSIELINSGSQVAKSESQVSHVTFSIHNNAAIMKEQIHAFTHVSVTKSIDNFGSFALIFNNLVGPAMLGFPHLFQKAGLIPVILMIILVYICSSFCGTMLADAISSIPCNKKFERDVDFSTAFHIIVGGEWYVLTQTLFLISCFVQAVAAIVESAQSIDGILASFILGRTYAVQLLPVPRFVSWSPEFCKIEAEDQEESPLSACTPFNEHGPLLLTVGYCITCLLFVPLGRGQLKETVWVQIFSLLVFVLLLSVFVWEFEWRGLDYSVPLVGRNFSQLAGVVLFNFAYTVTVPSWLCEKKPEVSVNGILWSATSIGSVVYVLFGVMGAAAFEQAGPNLLVLLASNKVHHITRVCAALFGVVIIGCGVPVFCVIIKNVLNHTNFCSPSGALFCGATLPFLVGWLLYQGSALMEILNWTGLLVNGSVAFLLPSVLSYKTVEVREYLAKRRKRERKEIEKGESSASSASVNIMPPLPPQTPPTAPRPTPMNHNSHINPIMNSNSRIDKENYSSMDSLFALSSEDSELQAEGARIGPFAPTPPRPHSHSIVTMDEERDFFEGSVEPLPASLASSWLYKRVILVLIAAYCAIFTVTIILDAVDHIVPDRVEYFKRKLTFS